MGKLKAKGRVTSDGIVVDWPRPFDAWDTRDLPPMEVLRRAWDKPLRHEDGLLDHERRLLAVAQCVRDWTAVQRQKGETA